MKEILVLAGPSAVGKTTVASHLLASGEFALVRSVTTRAPRGDAFDSEYIYLSKEKMQALVKEGGVLEHTEYAGELYGTPASEIERIIAEGKHPLLILDLNGVATLSKREDIRPCAVYIHAPLEVLEARLRARYLDPEKGIIASDKLDSRLKKNREDYASIANCALHFYAFVENSDTPLATASAVRKEFSSFLSGEERDAVKMQKVAQRISESAL